MVENLNGKEPQGFLEISIGKKFFLFNPSRTKNHYDNPTLFKEYSDFTFTGAEDWPKLYFHAEVGGYNTDTGLNFLPFDLNETYSVTNEDFDPSSRLKKTKTILQEHKGKPEFTSQFLLLVAIGYPSDINYDHETYGKLQKKFDRLRLQLTINGLSFEAKRIENQPWAYFLEFYPLDAGELPPDVQEKNGHAILLPASIDKLSQIEAKFVLTEDNSEEAAANKADQSL